MSATVLEGGCLCGAIRYAATARPERPHYCHCRICQQASGAPLVAWVKFDRDGFRWTRGSPRMIESSTVMKRGFCADCGTSLCTIEDDDDGYVYVTIATLDRYREIEPEFHIYSESFPPWLRLNDNLPRVHRNDRT